MKPSLPNLFESLFEFHPRPKENFLTESFAYLLRTDEGVRNCWLSLLLGRKIERAACEVFTRQTERDVEDDTPVYPDLVLVGQLSNGERFAVYCEHKWDSPCNQGQLKRYHKVVLRTGSHAHLVFVGATLTQRSDAERCFFDKCFKCFLWEDVFNALDGVPNKSPILKEFLDFMKSHGLSPALPLTVETMRAFLQASGFLKSLLNFANKLNTNYSWDVIPNRFHASNYVHDAWGRVGIRFETEEWKPALTAGFLYDETDHKVKLVNREKGIDLLLRIEAEPKNTRNIQPALAVLDQKRKDLKRTAASVLLKGEHGNGNPYSVLIVRECLGGVIENANTEGEQLEAIHKKLTQWLQVLFKDGLLEKAFKKCHLDSGMK
jgi:hypothetical protein